MLLVNRIPGVVPVITVLRITGGMIKQAWCSALGVDVGCHATLVHFPAWPAVWLERDDDDTGFQQVLERADYLAKEHTKAHCTGERNFGCSRS